MFALTLCLKCPFLSKHVKEFTYFMTSLLLVELAEATTEQLPDLPFQVIGKRHDKLPSNVPKAVITISYASGCG